jgi:hypothetical protein
VVLITPSTDTFVVVVSFMVAGPFSSAWSSFGTTAPPHRTHRSWHAPCCSSRCAFSEHGPHVGDVLLNRHREHRRARFLVKAAAAEGLAGRLRLPALEDVDAAAGRADRRRSRNRDSQLPGAPVRRVHPAREVGFALAPLNPVPCSGTEARGNTEGTPARARASRREYSSSLDPFSLRGFSCPRLPAFALHVPPRRSMLRRGSTVRVRQRALQKRRIAALFLSKELAQSPAWSRYGALYAAFRFRAVTPKGRKWTHSPGPASGAAGLQESNGDEFCRGFQSVSTPDQPHSRRTT